MIRRNDPSPFLRRMACAAFACLVCLPAGCSRPDRDESGSRPEAGAPAAGGGEREAGRSGADRSQEAAEVPEVETYRGPPLRAELEVMESHPEQYAVLVEVTAPTAGWTLEEEGVGVEKGRTRVRLVLEEPGPDELNAAVLETLESRTVLGADVSWPVEVLVSRRQRGVVYVQEPPYELAAVLARP